MAYITSNRPFRGAFLQFPKSPPQSTLAKGFPHVEIIHVPTTSTSMQPLPAEAIYNACLYVVVFA
ncbi:hypothetical protein BDV30DRAFT_217485 [Aspergillus minisclerotigenes]|uniref:Uncharacterized protein n=1 Tax=Aspergillus minisclerotigenes TaxID=656917 RepID=A0A5N6IST1_9EURO|nr:hypothetical protein BDV30DRAFT_217485 [Aspergillus minisclerotigenes]